MLRRRRGGLVESARQRWFASVAGLCSDCACACTRSEVMRVVGEAFTVSCT